MQICWFCGVAGIVSLHGLLRDSVRVLLKVRLLALVAHSLLCQTPRPPRPYALFFFLFLFYLHFIFGRALFRVFLLIGVMTPSH